LELRAVIARLQFAGAGAAGSQRIAAELLRLRELELNPGALVGRGAGRIAGFATSPLASAAASKWPPLDVISRQPAAVRSPSGSR
jgi:hypothetical protein